MTAEEAIKIIERIQDPEPRELPYRKVFEALGMAIEALKKVGDVDMVPTETKNLHWKEDQTPALGRLLGVGEQYDHDALQRRQCK